MQASGIRAFANKQRVDERERPKESESLSQRSAKDRFHSVRLQVAGSHAFANVPRHGDVKKLEEDQGDVVYGVGPQTSAPERSPWDGIGFAARAESDRDRDVAGAPESECDQEKDENTPGGDMGYVGVNQFFFKEQSA